jgi:hypothetical protein
MAWRKWPIIIRKYNDSSMAYNENNIKLMAAGYKLKKQ